MADKIAADAWRLRRIPMLEAAVHRRSRHDREIEKAQDAVYKVRAAETAAMFSAITRIPPRSNDRVDAERTLQAVKNRKANLFMRDPVLEASRVLETSVVVFANLWRHERALTHAIHRTLHELQRLQAMRHGELVPAPAVIDVRLHADPDPQARKIGRDRHPNRTEAEDAPDSNRSTTGVQSKPVESSDRLPDTV